MPRLSSGILLYRLRDGEPQVLLVHPGGPLWERRDEGVWSIPKGEHGADDEPLGHARREFEEELGTPPPAGEPIDLGTIRQRGGKRVTAWALEGDLDATAARSNTFSMEWPPRSGRRQEFPEVDRAEWFPLHRARAKILPAQAPLLDRLAQRLGGGAGGATA